MKDEVLGELAIAQGQRDAELGYIVGVDGFGEFLREMRFVVRAEIAIEVSRAERCWIIGFWLPVELFPETQETIVVFEEFRLFGPNTPVHSCCAEEGTCFEWKGC